MKIQSHELIPGAYVAIGEEHAVFIVTQPGQDCHVTRADQKGIGMSVPASCLRPIRLSDEWLEKLNVKKLEVKVSKGFGGGYDIRGLHPEDPPLYTADYVHELQMAVALFTGQLLQLK